MKKFEPSHTILINFNGKVIHVARQLALNVVTETIWVRTFFLVEASNSPNNAILGHSQIHTTTTVTLTYHQKIKILTVTGVVEVLGEQLIAR